MEIGKNIIIIAFGWIPLFLLIKMVIIVNDSRYMYYIVGVGQGGQRWFEMMLHRLSL